MNLWAFSAAQRTTAAAPSLSGAQSNSPSGSATQGLCRTASIVISFWNWASGFSAPFLWFFTATEAMCSRVVPYSYMWRRAIIAYSPANVAPKTLSHSWSAVDERISAAWTSPTSVIFSAPPTTTMSYMPEAIARRACSRAIAPHAPPPSTRTVGRCMSARPE